MKHKPDISFLECLEAEGFDAIGRKTVLSVFSGHKNSDLVICDIMMPELDGYGV